MSSAPPPPLTWFDRIERAPTVFAASPARQAVAEMTFADARPVAVHVVRNRPFEGIATLAERFAGFAGYAPRFTFSEYDDALSDVGDGLACVVLVWLAFDHYAGMSDADFKAWLLSRLAAIRASGAGTIVLAADDALDVGRVTGLEVLTAALPDVFVWSTDEVARRLGGAYRDHRMASISGDSLSREAVMELARAFGLSILPAALEPRLKAVVTDLDLTLYEGVLGEDGPEDLVLSEGHRRLQQQLAELSQSGLFIGVVSKNEPDDAYSLFEAREDFPLRPEAVTAWAVSWNPKPQGMVSILERLRVGPDAVLYIDDNVGELAAMAQAFPTMRLLHADPGAHDAARALDRFPGLFARTVSEEDRLRARDLTSTAFRETIAAQAPDKASYLRMLDVRIDLGMDPVDQRPRLADLCRKTNQFNLALKRLDESEVASRLERPDAAVAAGWLSDKLADAGLIAAIYGVRTDEAVEIDELCLSCRSLGRGIEDLIILHAFDAMVRRFDVETVRVHWTRGPRNMPALKWLEQMFDVALPDDEAGVLDLAWGPERLAVLEGLPVTLEWRS